MLFVKRRRNVSVPKVDLFPASPVKSRSRLGAAAGAMQDASSEPLMVSLRRTGLERFSGPGEPSLFPAPMSVACVST